MKQFLTSKDTSKWILCVLAIAFILGLSACTSKPVQPAEVPAADESDGKGSERPEVHDAVDGSDGTGNGAQEVHVATGGSDDSGSGTPEEPYATVSYAARTMPGSVIVVHGGTYEPIRLDADASGTEDSPTYIRPTEGETVVVRAEGEVCISIFNTSHIVIEGIETEGGTHGIDYESTREAEDAALSDITFRKCTVHGVRGVHGICVYARNDLTAVSGITVEDCEVYDCGSGSSESVVLNGNIDGLLIVGNRVHDNNNIGIDMIGFEGTAMHPDQASGKNQYETDRVRNGICRDNVIYNISAEGNEAYFEDGEYDLCADGIYVDGGCDIEICNNFIFNCDIGMEVATEHSPEENEIFKVTGVNVHDNVIADCHGWAGIGFGGCEPDLGFTEECEFAYNTLVDNSTQIGVQRSMNNRVYANLILGGETAVEFNDDLSKEDMQNDISGNAAADFEDEDSWTDEYGKLYADREEAAEDFRSLIDDVGSRFVPDEDLMELYRENLRMEE